MKGDTISVSQAHCLKMIQTKGCQCFCSRDMQKQSIENCLAIMSRARPIFFITIPSIPSTVFSGTVKGANTY